MEPADLIDINDEGDAACIWLQKLENTHQTSNSTGFYEMKWIGMATATLVTKKEKTTT